MEIEEIKKMSASERLQTMEALWDSLLYEGNEIKSPDWHKDILEIRKRKIKTGKAKFIDIEDLKPSS